MPGDPVLAPQPTYLQSRRTSQKVSGQCQHKIDLKLNMRCFFTGVMLSHHSLYSERGKDTSSGKEPWRGTRDHLVPARRDVPGQPTDYQNYPTTLVWCANVVNVTLGLSPLPVRLKIRQWLQTVRMEREHPTLEDGINLRWLLIEYLDHFRIQGRYPWSRRADGCWWYPDISERFMHRMWDMELEFLKLDPDHRDQWIQNFRWQF